jgi:hypothetical protein
MNPGRFIAAIVTRSTSPPGRPEDTDQIDALSDLFLSEYHLMGI